MEPWAVVSLRWIFVFLFAHQMKLSRYIVKLSCFTFITYVLLHMQLPASAVMWWQLIHVDHGGFRSPGPSGRCWTKHRLTHGVIYRYRGNTVKLHGGLKVSAGPEEGLVLLDLVPTGYTLQVLHFHFECAFTPIAVSFFLRCDLFIWSSHEQFLHFKADRLRGSLPPCYLVSAHNLLPLFAPKMYFLFWLRPVS